MATKTPFQPVKRQNFVDLVSPAGSLARSSSAIEKKWEVDSAGYTNFCKRGTENPLSHAHWEDEPDTLKVGTEVMRMTLAGPGRDSRFKNKVISMKARSGGSGIITSFVAKVVEVTGGEFMTSTSRRTLGHLLVDPIERIEAAKTYAVELKVGTKAIKGEHLLSSPYTIKYVLDGPETCISRDELRVNNLEVSRAGGATFEDKKNNEAYHLKKREDRLQLSEQRMESASDVSEDFSGPTTVTAVHQIKLGGKFELAQGESIRIFATKYDTAENSGKIKKAYLWLAKGTRNSIDMFDKVLGANCNH
jgi:hypothetical protein